VRECKTKHECVFRTLPTSQSLTSDATCTCNFVGALDSTASKVNSDVVIILFHLLDVCNYSEQLTSVAPCRTYAEFAFRDLAHRTMGRQASQSLKLT